MFTLHTQGSSVRGARELLGGMCGLMIQSARPDREMGVWGYRSQFFLTLQVIMPTMQLLRCALQSPAPPTILHCPSPSPNPCMCRLPIFQMPIYILCYHLQNEIELIYASLLPPVSRIHKYPCNAPVPLTLPTLSLRSPCSFPSLSLLLPCHPPTLALPSLTSAALCA